MYTPQEAWKLICSGQIVQAGEISDIQLMLSTLTDFLEVHQFDAKRRTFFMSRRPFFHMLLEILEETCNKNNPVLTDEFSRVFLRDNVTHVLAFARAMAENGKFQVYDEQDEPLDLTDLTEYFDESVKNISISIYEATITLVPELLKRGLISTTMLRYINLDRLEADGILSPDAKIEILRMRNSAQYYIDVLSSVDPRNDSRLVRRFLKITKADRLFIDLEPLEEGKFSGDLFSPFPLDADDAICRYREGAFAHEVEKFGSAIVELRCIEYLIGLNSEGHATGIANFLTDPVFVLEESVALFRKIKELTFSI
jgi:hypothetical protein